MKSLIVFAVLLAFVYVCYDTSIIEDLLPCHPGGASKVFSHGTADYVVPVLLALIYAKEK